MSTHHHRDDDNQRWRVEVDLAKDGSDTVAVAAIYVADAIYEAHGEAHRDAVSPTVAEKLAVARALGGLAHQLIDDASHEVDRVAHALNTYTSEVEAAAKDEAALLS